MRKNEYTSINEFVSQYVGEWNPSEGHWLGLDFLYHGSEYRFYTGSMYETDAKLPDGREIMFGIYRKNNSKKGKEYEILGEFANMDEALECKVIEGTCFKDIIMADETELIGQD